MDTNPDRIENVRERGLLYRFRAPKCCSALSRSDGADTLGAVLMLSAPATGTRHARTGFVSSTGPPCVLQPTQPH
jgi:hypothetical protein